MMNKQLLLEKYIKVAVRKALKEEEAKQQKATKAMYLIYRFPGLKKVIEELMSPSFGRFITNVSIIAPKPTTFQIEMINGEDFTIRYDGKKNYTAKVAGRRYDIQQLSELERAQQSIADLLELDYAIDEKDGGGEVKTDAGAEAFSAAAGAPTTTPEAPPAETSAEETPAPEEETPAEA